MTTGVEEPGRSTDTGGGAWWFWEVEPEWNGEDFDRATAEDVADFVGADVSASDEDYEPPPAPQRRSRLMLGLAVLAGERLRASPPTGPLLTGVGLLQLGAAEAGEIARRAVGPSKRLAARGAAIAARLPGADASRRSVARSRERFEQMLDEARRRGEITVAAGRAEAVALMRSTVADGLEWAQQQAVPQLVDGLVPHLVDEVMPRLIDGALPTIRSRVVPAVVDELTNAGDVREAVRHHARGVIDEAIGSLRRSTDIDDHIESGFRRLIRAAHPGPDGPAEPELEEAPEHQHRGSPESG